MMQPVSEIIRRTSVTLEEGERPEFKAGPRTTFVVTGAVLELPLTPSGKWTFRVSGHRKQNPRAQWYTGAEYREGGGMPVELHDLWRTMMESRTWPPEREPA